ncbi:MAG: hypothetical protein IKJ55_03800 [Clostridia bacterium]|nr:hypothetical protein [Clostridia bacterium]
MKKTICMIYRLAYIILGLWIFAEHSGYSMPRFFGLLPLQNFWFAALLLAFMGIGFWFLLQNASPRWFEAVSTGCVLLAISMLLRRADIWLSVSNPDWMLTVLLPFLVLLDWILFAQKGSTDIKQLLLAVAAVAGVTLLFQFLFKGDAVNLMTMTGCLRFLSELVVPAAALYFLDKLFCGRAKSTGNTLQLLVRLIFLVLEAYAFYKISGGDVREMLGHLKYAGPLLNALCFLCVLLQVIFMATGKQGSGNALLRAKGFLLVGMLLCMAVYWFQTKALPKTITSETAFIAICPALFVVEWLLFEKKNVFQPKDVFLWMIPPAVYYVVFILLGKWVLDMHLYPDVESIGFISVIGGGVLVFLGLGLLVYAVDRVLKRR